MPNRNIILKSLVGTPVTILFQDVDGVFQWFVNPQSVWAERDRTGLSESDIFPPEDIEVLAGAKREAFDTGEPRTVEVVAREKSDNGRIRRWNLRLTVNRAKDNQVGTEGFIYSCTDITEQVQREQTLRNLLREVAHRSKNM